MTGLSFLATSQGQGEALYFSEKKFRSQYTPEEILLEIKKEIENETALKNCKEVSVVYANTSYTLVPNSLFDEKRLSEYLKFNAKILSGDYLAYDTLTSQELNIVYIPLVNVNNYLYETFGSFQYYHAATLLLQHIFEKEATRFATRAYIQMFHDHFDLVILKEGALVLCNSYPFKTPEDLAYYVLFALEQLQLMPDSIETKMLGEIEEDDANFAILYTYIRNIEILSTENSVSIKEAKPHQHVLLKTAFL
ncbi:DUF3822 family protein [Marinirhabdus gelatinilytica]|uniref:Uncharacterized protein DUF3822 n=1 Tax=Marinirhabdus gelatinilytica TaxID=1703343 RepID=A0A370QBD1_9FLAO|nr:DUF3822 family protein [Marinirhabdus gelatinilytica]RDK85310.1 uncharacterized protein DUF3822 [Marinirhabdus gelatinilytica]